MKRGTPEHPKTLALAAGLKIPRWGAVGILESLWHWTARYAPLGNVGKYSNEQIARGIGWVDEPDILINCLLSVKLLDKSNDHRIVVHDWSDHCDEGVRKYVKRNSLEFCSVATNPDSVATKPDNVATQSGHVCHGKTSEYGYGNGYGNGRGGMEGNGRQAEALYDLYPRHVKRQDSLRAINKALKSVSFDVLEAAVKEYAAARAAPGHDEKYTPHCSTWFNKRRWEDDRSEWSKPDGGNGSGGGLLDPNDESVIDAAMRQGGIL